MESPRNLQELADQIDLDEARTVAGALSIYARVHEWMEDPERRAALVSIGFVPACYDPTITSTEIRALAAPVEDAVDRRMAVDEFGVS